MKKLRNNKIRKLLAFMVALALMVSCMPSAYTISASEAFGDGTEDIFTDGEITSEPAAEESTPDVSSADQEETEQAQQSTLTYENDSVKVTAEALEDGALPQNTALKADSVNENSSVSYDTVSQKLSAAATDKGSSLRGFFAYDVYFADGDGNRVEPNGRVRVTFEYKTPAAPELTDAASTSVTVEKLHYNSSTGDTDVNTLQANEDLKVLNVNEGKQIQTLQVETGNAAVFAVMWDSPETADVEAEAVSGNEDEVPIASEELTDGMDISDEPEQDAAETPAAENPDAEPTEAPAEDPDVVEEPAEDIASPEEVPAADENGETSLIEVLGDDTNLRVSPSIEAEVLATVNAGTQFTLLDTVTAEDGATWYKVSWEGTEAYIRSDMAQVVDSSDEAEEPEDVLESEEVSYSQEVGNVVVTATAAKGVIPEGAQFVVTPIEKGSDQYADIEKQLHEGAENESYTVAGFLAYDISFLNDDGTKIEAQNGSVRVSIAYKEAEIPEDVAETDTAQENMNVSLVHFVEDANGNVTEVVNMSNDGQAEVSTTDNGEIESANFETESFSTFSVVWLADDFTSVQTTSSYGVEETVDSAKRGITINMFNYDTAGINEGHSLKFSNGSDGGNEDYNKYRGPSDLSLGIMQKRLGEDSYPIVDKGKKESSSYLFSTKEGTGKEFYSDANYLFKQDADGYYEYDSTKNFAQFNKNTKEFTVYKVPGSSKDPIDLQQGSKHGSFFPFNTLGDHKYWGIPQISEKSPDFHFGMTMSAKFIQPKDGKINGNNMVFEFSGDDDVWVYIDGVLVLDIGGIHNSVSGSIDFAEGTVKVGSNNYTLKNLFKEAGAEKEGDFVSRKDIFKDYTVHTINFYYLERGKGDSNCKLKFNLPTVPDGSVKVQKQLSKIELGSDAKVTVTNTRNNVASLEITKVNTSNQSLPGAKFTLTLDGDSAKTYNVTSDENGLLKFENLSVGTYTLTETEAPSGYVKSTESYKVKVSVENNKATAKLYKADGTNEIENKQIINYTEKEEAENNLTSSKTAKVVDYENRIYKINLNAETTGREGDVEAQGASVVMVLDASDSMNDSIANTNTSKLVALQNAANTFIDTLKSKSPESEIAIIWYSGSEGGNTSITNSKFKQLNNNEDVSSLKRTIDNKDASGGTPMGVALATARNQLSSAKHEKNKYVVFMTDGLPGHNNNDNWNCMVANNAVNNANSIKEQATLYTVGVGLNDAGSFNWKLGHSSTSSNSGHGYKYEYYRHKSITGSEFLSQYIATKSSDGTKKYAYDTSGLNDLVNTFNVIAGSIGDLFTVQPKEIVDVIDARFKLTDDGLNDLATNSRLGTGKIKTNNDGSKEIIWTDSTTGSVVGKVTIVERGDGTTKITWKEQAARIGNAATENENDKGWNASFRIQAKDDFIGGNMIPTNGADSGIYLNGGGIKEFEQPSVNVKLLNLNIGSKKITVFKGDPITAKNFGNELAETIKVVQLNKKETLTAVEPMDAGKNSVKLPDLEDADIKKLNTDKELTIGSEGRYQYIYPGSKDAVGYFTYTYKIVRGNADEHLANSVGEKVEEYQLTVTYHPYSKEVRKQKLAKIKEPDEEVYTAENAPKPDLVEQPKGGISVDSSVASTGTYTVKVIAGELKIVKKLDAQAEKEETFRFTITDKNGDVATATAKIAKGGKEATAVFELVGEANAKLELDNKKLSELSRGDYVVKESSDNTSYELQSIVTGEGTNCDSAIAEDLSNGITFTMGTDKKQNKVPQNGNTTDGRVGIAEFTNKKTVVNIDFEKVDAETNTKKLSGAEFDLYKANTDGEQTGDPIKQYVSDKNGKVSIENLPIGNYVLVERKAPAGYQLSAKPWKIIVGSDRNITVTHGDDTVSPKGNEKIYQLTNAKLYSLPNSGGPGTYGFTISGVAILATALLLFINNKRREEEAKRS